VSRYAVIDVGTNSVKFAIGEPGGEIDVDRAEMTRLGEGLDDTGELQPEPMARTADAIAAMVEEARSAGVDGIAAVGTAGLRIARNSADFVATVKDRTGVEIEVIPGEEESRLAYVAVTAGLEESGGTLVVFDTGGGSSQFTFGHAGQVDERWSDDVGAVRFTERFGLDRPVSAEVVAEARAAIGADFGRLDGRPAPDAMVGIGGAVTNMAAVKHGLATYDPDVVRGTVLDAAEIDRQIELYRTRTADERREIAGLQPKRAEVILAGACIVRTIVEKLGRDSFSVSDRGLRHGLLNERFG
jgi:exopolyphosphatase/guanosine-5'-triphosphate,3'-diphosphate pyrophosphatase